MPKVKSGKKTKIGIKKTSSRGKLNNLIHDEMRRIAIKRHPYCVCCGKSETVLQGGHLIPKKSSTATRYDLMNVFTQCRDCNYKHQYNPHIYIDWFIKEYGLEEYQDLVKKSRVVKPIKITELRTILEEYKKL